MRFTTSFALSAVLVISGTIHAVAVPAATRTNVNVRSGPGTHYGVVASLPAGSAVEVFGCTGSWCQTQYGYVSARLLSQGGVYPGAASVSPYAGISPGTNYRQPVAQAVQQPFLPVRSAVAAAPSTIPSTGTNYRQPLGAQPQAGVTPGETGAIAYDTQAGIALGTAPVVPGVTTGVPGSFGTMHGARTTIGETNVRSGPGTEYSILKVLPDFTKVEVQSCANQWCQTDEGYISLFHLSRGPVQQVLSPAARSLLPGSGSRDSAYYAGNLAAQATMGYGAGGAGAAGVVGTPNYRAAYGRPAVQPVAAGRAYAPANYGATPYGASAGQASVRTSANVRSGPGTRFGVVASLPAGSLVDIMSCTGSWCQTQYGYVSARLLSQGGVYPGAASVSPYAGISPGTNYRQSMAQAVQQPFLPARPAVAAAPSTIPSTGTNYRQPLGAQPQAGLTPGETGAVAYDTQAGIALGTAPVVPGVTTGVPGSFGTMHGARTTIGETNVRSGPGTEYSILKVLPDFTKVEVQSCANQWCQTDEGYISLFHLSRGPVQQVLSPAARSLLPGSGSRDSAYYAGNLAAQATMGYGAGGAGAAGVVGTPNYGAAYGRPAVQPVAAGRAYAPANYGATPYGASAGQASVRTSANVRSGPGTRFGVVASLPAGSLVDIMSCTGSWCQTQYGYVSARLLSQGGVYPGAASVSPYAGISPGTNYRQPVAQGVQQPFLPARPAVAAAPSTIPSTGTNYRQAAVPVLPRNVAANQGAAVYTQAPGTFTATGTGYVATTTAALRVRSGPGVRNNILGTLPPGSAVNVVSCNGSWCQTQYGYVSARHLSTGGGLAPGAGYSAPGIALVPPQTVPPTRASSYAPVASSYRAPAYAPRAYAAPSYNAGYAGTVSGSPYGTQALMNDVYPGSNYVQGATYPIYSTPTVGSTLLGIAALPFEAVAAVTNAVTDDVWGGGYGGPVGFGNGAGWRTSWGPQYAVTTGRSRNAGPGYWGPSLYGRNTTSNWGARPSYWGGRTTYWNVHPGYPTRAYRGDRRGNMYWSTRNEGRRPQAASWYSGSNRGLGPHWQGPYDAGPRYNGRPVVWRPRAGIF